MQAVRRLHSAQERVQLPVALEETSGIAVLHGSELNIQPDGSLD